MVYKKYEDIVPFGLRIQDDLKDELKKAARGKKKWSLNAEIEKRLEESFQARNELGQFSDGELIDELIKRWGRDAVCIRLGKDPDTP